MDIENFVELLVGRMTTVLEERLSNIEGEVKLLRYAVDGNGTPGLAEQIRTLGKEFRETHSALAKDCKDSHTVIHRRIDPLVKAPVGRHPDGSVKEVNIWKERFMGGWYTIVGLTALAASLATIYKSLHS